MLQSIYQTLYMLLAIYAVSANTILTTHTEHQTVYGERGAAVKLRCVVPTMGTTIAFIEWRFGGTNQLVYFDARNPTRNTGPKGKLAGRKVKGVFGENGTLHDLIIDKTVSGDEGWYKCRIRDSLKELFSKTFRLVLVVLPSNPPAIVYRNGTHASESDCDNNAKIPSVVVPDKAVFLCQVGKSSPASSASWERTFPVKAVKTLTDSTGIMIEVGTLSNFLLKCTIKTPSVNSANLTIRHICLMVTQGPQARAPLGNTNGKSIHIPWAIVVGVLTIIIIIVILPICLKKKFKDKYGIKYQCCHRRNKSQAQNNKKTQPQEAEQTSLLQQEGGNKIRVTSGGDGLDGAKEETSEKLQHKRQSASQDNDPDVSTVTEATETLQDKRQSATGDNDLNTSKEETEISLQPEKRSTSEGNLLDESTETTENIVQPGRRSTSVGNLLTESSETTEVVSETKPQQGPFHTLNIHRSKPKEAPEPLGKYNYQLAEKCLQWIQETINSNYENKVEFSTDGNEENFHQVLKSGWHLARFTNVLRTGLPASVLSKEETVGFRQMDVIDQVLKKIKELGIRDHEIFETRDLFDDKPNLRQVLICLQALGRKSEVFGPKEAKENKRHFTNNQLKAGQTVLPLQMGSNKGASQAGQMFGKQRMILD